MIEERRDTFNNYVGRFQVVSALNDADTFIVRTNDSRLVRIKRQDLINEASIVNQAISTANQYTDQKIAQIDIDAIINAAVSNANDYTDNAIANIPPPEPSFWVNDGTGLIKPADNKKVKEEHIQKEVRQIEIILSEDVWNLVDIDISELDLKNGEKIECRVNSTFLNSNFNPMDNRFSVRISDYYNSSEYILAGGTAKSQGWQPLTAGTYISVLIFEIGIDFNRPYLNTRSFGWLTDGLTFRTVTLNQFMHDSISVTSISSLRFLLVSNGYIKAGSKFIITKLN